MCLLASSAIVAQEKKCNQTVAACEQAIRQMLAGRLYLGIEVEEKNGGLVIKTVVPESPAWRAGFEPGDRLMQLNAHPTSEASIKDFKQILNQIFQDPHRVTRFYIIVNRHGLLKKIDARPEPYSKTQIDKIILQHLVEAHTATAQGPPRP
jgi:predicted metalloprotease with PDZ domain